MTERESRAALRVANCAMTRLPNGDTAFTVSVRASTGTTEVVSREVGTWTGTIYRRPTWPSLTLVCQTLEEAVGLTIAAAQELSAERPSYTSGLEHARGVSRPRAKPRKLPDGRPRGGSVRSRKGSLSDDTDNR